MFFCADKMAFRLSRNISSCKGMYLHFFRELSSATRSRWFNAERSSVNFRFPQKTGAWVSTVNIADDNLSFVPCRFNATKQDKSAASGKTSLMQARESPYAHLTVGQKVKEVGKDVSYFMVVVVGFTVTGFIFYVIGSELFSSESPTGVYGDALKKCQDNYEVTSALGEPIKAYGETSRRGRRRLIKHTEFDVDGVPHMRVQFYIEGPNHRKATVHVEVQKDDKGKFEYRYLVVEIEGYPHRTFVLEDNRQKLKQAKELQALTI